MTRTKHESLESLFAEGNTLMAAGDGVAAEACFRRALAMSPDTAELHANLGLLLNHRGEVVEAEACYLQAISLQPGRLETHLNLGALLASQKRFSEAEARYVDALEIDDRSAVAWSNLGVLYASMRRDDEAEACYLTALTIDPRYGNARFNSSYLFLRQGRFDVGWAALEARDWYAALAMRMPCPRWQGEALDGLSVLIGFEAGHGDMIMFSRFAATLKSRGAARITLLCHPALKQLFESLDAVDALIGFDEALPADHWDVWTPPLSIPFHLGIRLDNLPADLPYLHAEPDRVAQWRPSLPIDEPLVGLVWKGSPRFENDADRSLPSLATLAPLAAVAGVRFVSLQKGAGEREADHPPAGLDVLNLGPQMRHFADAAAIVSQLDLLISVDTAMAHLAGALGRPCWLLLPDYQTDWRWLVDRSDSPWYPGVMRLFRQPAGGGWEPVIVELARVLRSMAEGRASTPG